MPLISLECKFQDRKGFFMRCFIVHNVASFIKWKHVWSFHYNMFHGLSVRVGEADPGHKNYMLGDELCDPLELTKNVFELAEIFCPSLNWVVSSRVQAKLQSFSHIDFLQVIFSKKVSCPYRPGDFSFDKDPRYNAFPIPGRTKAFLKSLPEVFTDVGVYYEMVVARLKDIQSQFKDLSKITYSLNEVGTVEPKEAFLSKALLQQYPILWHGDHFLSEEAYECVADDLNHDYFYIQSVEVNA